MKTTRPLIALVCFIVLICPFISHATDDTDVYDISTNVNPNVLIIFDNSTSMSNGIPYEDTVHYPPETYVWDTIYRRGTCKTYQGFWCIEYYWNVYTGTFTDNSDPKDGIDDDSSRIRKGNRLNYDNNVGDADKIDVAKTVTKEIIEDTYPFVRLGIMLLEGDLRSSNANYFKDTTILSTTYGGSEIKQWDNAGVTATDKDTLKNYVDTISIGSWLSVHYTPLANRLIAAAQYFKHVDSTTFGNFATGFTDPIDSTYWCRKNYVILVTDGMPTKEGNTKSADDDAEGEFSYIESFLGARTDGNYSHGTYNYDYNPTASPPDTDTDPYCDYFTSNPDNSPYGGSHYLDDVAKYLYDTDLRTTIQETQNITTFVIGFAVDDPFLQRVADNGHGEYYTAQTSAELELALRRAMATIIDRAQTFTAPVVPVQRTSSGDKMYISLFTPKSTEKFWPGYLVKLKIGSNGELMGFSSDYGSGTEIQVTDSYGALNPDLLKSDRPPYPYWDAQRKLISRTIDRNIYTFLGNPDLTDTSNTFNTTNINATMLANPTRGTTPVADLINYIYGLDAYDEDEDSNKSEKRDYILGDILHAKPLIIDYASDPDDPHRVIYVGTNDGMLHAFRDTDGFEKWGFIPPDLLPKLKNMTETSVTGHQYYVDSSPQAYIKDVDHDGNIESGDQVVIIFGERRGGTSYCALDVTDPDNPQYLWRIDNAVAGFEEMGQSWSEPVIGKVKAGTVGSEIDTIVAIIGGGYSDDNSAGRALYLINVLDGSLIKGFTSSDDANLAKSIPSTVLAADTNFDGYVNRVYVGDLGGQMWRFGLQRTSTDDLRFEDGNVNNWTPRRLFASALSNPKIFYPPDMVLEPGYAYLYFGTGDREDPMDMTDTNRFYAVKDRNVIGTYTTLVDTNLVNVTADQLQDPNVSEADKQIIRNQLATGNGWYMTLDTAEKVLAPPTVISGMLLFTTFTPVDTLANPCSYGGDARLYVVDYLTAVSVMDLDADGDVDMSDQSTDIGQGIPTEVVVTITDTGETRGYIGAGGGIIEVELTGSVSRFNIDAWREEF
jgi:type IV pilus assembly protein PilY1